MLTYCTSPERGGAAKGGTIDPSFLQRKDFLHREATKALFLTIFRQYKAKKRKPSCPLTMVRSEGVTKIKTSQS